MWLASDDTRIGVQHKGRQLHQHVDLKSLVEQRIVELRNCNTVLRNESTRLGELKKQRATVRIAAETETRQQGLGIAETDQVGQKAADSVEDPGPRMPAYTRRLCASTTTT